MLGLLELGRRMQDLDVMTSNGEPHTVPWVCQLMARSPLWRAGPRSPR